MHQVPLSQRRPYAHGSDPLFSTAPYRKPTGVDVVRAMQVAEHDGAIVRISCLSHSYVFISVGPVPLFANHSCLLDPLRFFLVF